jgi:hypothetical protein
MQGGEQIKSFTVMAPAGGFNKKRGGTRRRKIVGGEDEEEHLNGMAGHKYYK